MAGVGVHRQTASPIFGIDLLIDSFSRVLVEGEETPAGLHRDRTERLEQGAHVGTTVGATEEFLDLPGVPAGDRYSDELLVVGKNVGAGRIGVSIHPGLDRHDLERWDGDEQIDPHVVDDEWLTVGQAQAERLRVAQLATDPHPTVAFVERFAVVASAVNGDGHPRHGTNRGALVRIRAGPTSTGKVGSLLDATPDHSADERAPGIFRGWYIVGAGFTVLFVVYGLQFSYGEFRLAATEEEGWSQTTLSLIFAIYIGTYSLLSAVSGWATDRFGPRRTVAAGAFVLCAGYLTWASASSLLVVFIALAVVAPIGMSCSWVPVNATAVRWFIRRRGVASAIVTTGGSAGNIVAPPIAAWLIAGHGWRTALAIMASVGLVLMLGAAMVLVRDPESVGLLPDGDTSDMAQEVDANAVTAAEAVRSRTYWYLWAMYSLTFIVVFVPFVHGSAHAVDLGISKLTAATVVSSIGVGGVVGRLLVGSISDRIDRRRAVIVALALQVASFLGLAGADGLSLLYPSAALFGFGYGGAVAVFPALVGDYFGRVHAGSIVGRMFASAGALAAVGPYVAALIFDQTQSYRAAFVIAAALNGVAFVIALRLPRPTGAPPVVSPARAEA